MGAGLSFPDVAVAVSNADPNDPAATDNYTDLSARAWRIRNAGRGRQYENQQNFTGRAQVEFRNVDEFLNPANASSTLLANAKPFRRTRIVAMYPRVPAAGQPNLFNSTNIGGCDPSFETSTVGSLPAWLAAVGGTTPTVQAANPHGGANSLQYTVAGGATVQGVSAQMLCLPGRQYTASIWVRQSSASTQQIAVTGAATGTSTAATATYVRLAVTFTATATTHTLTLQTTGTAVAGTVNLDDFQYEVGAAATANATLGPKIRGIWGGHLERLTVGWVPGTNGYEGAVIAPCVGPLAALAQLPMHTELMEAILAKKPAYYWPLWDGPTASIFAEISGNAGPAIGRVDGDFGGATLTSGVATNLAGDPSGTGVQFTQQNGGPLLSFATSLDNFATSTDFPSAVGSNAANWAASLAMVFTCPDTTITTGGGAGVAIFGVYGYQPNITQNSYYPFIRLIPDGAGTGKIALYVSDQFFGGTAQVLSTTTFASDTKLHLIVATVSQVGTTQTLKIYVDGVLQNTATANTTATFGVAQPDFRCFNVEICGEVVRTGVGGPNGTYTHCGAWNRELSAAEVTDLQNAFNGYPAETSGTRVSRQLGLYYTGPTVLSAGRSPMSASPVTEDAALLAALQTITDSEMGNLFETRDGAVGWEARDDRFKRVAAVATFGENFAGGQIPYQETISYDSDLQLVANQVAVTQANGTKAIAANDTTGSAKSYYPRPLALTVYLNNALEAIDRANWEQINRAQPKQRLAAITVNVGANPALFPQILDLEIGQRYTVVRNAKAANSGAGLVMSGDYFLENINHHDIDPEAGTWLVDLQLSPVPAQPWILGDATYGQLGVTTVLGF